VLHKLVKLVHIDIHQELRGEITERKSYTFLFYVEAADYLRKKPENTLVGDARLENADETTLVNRRKELTHVALEHPDRLRVIARDAVRESAEAVERFVASLVLTARVRTRNEGLIEKWIQQAIERVMEQAVADACFMDAARFRVGDVERLVIGMAVGLLA